MKENSFRFSFIVYRLSKKFLFILRIFIFSLIFIGCAKYPIKNLDSSGKNIICFGDSITLGYGAGEAEDFPTQLAKLLNMPVINAGKDGDTSSDALFRLEKDVLEKEPFLVIVEFAGNDFLKKIPLEVTLKNVAEIIERIQEKGAMVALVDISSSLLMREYRSAFYKLARKKKAIFIGRLLEGIITNPSLKSDFIHPNAAGYKIIAQRIYQAISPYIKRDRH